MCIYYKLFKQNINQNAILNEAKTFSLNCTVHNEYIPKKVPKYMAAQTMYTKIPSLKRYRENKPNKNESS